MSSPHMVNIEAAKSSINELQSIVIVYLSTGNVKKVEVKHKKQPDTEEILSTFAFISIVADDHTLKQCKVH